MHTDRHTGTTMGPTKKKTAPFNSFKIQVGIPENQLNPICVGPPSNLPISKNRKIFCYAHSIFLFKIVERLGFFVRDLQWAPRGRRYLQQLSMYMYAYIQYTRGTILQLNWTLYMPIYRTHKYKQDLIINIFMLLNIDANDAHNSSPFE